MAEIKYNAVSPEATILNTELDSLADDTLCSAGTAVTAASTELYANIKLIIAAQASARDTGAAVYVWLIPESDGVYSDAAEDCLGNPNLIFGLDAATTTRTLVKTHIPLPNSNFKPILKNSTGQALASSGNTLEFEYYSMESA